MDLKMRLVEEAEGFTICDLYINDVKECITMQDGTVTADGHPRIAAGRWPVRLRVEGGFHEKYLQRFGSAFHKGMLEIFDVPGRKYLLFHIGNTPENTLGCVLTGAKRDPVRKDFIQGSELAYRKFYPKVVKALLRGEPVYLDIRYTHA